MTKFFSFFLLLIITGNLSAQNQALNGYTSDKLKLSSDSSKVKFSPGKTNFLLKSAILPVSLVTVGVIIESLPAHTVFSKERIQLHVQDKMNGFRTSADNYLQFVPIAAMFGFKLSGMKSRSDLLNQTIITAKSELLVIAIVSTMKHFIRDMRPRWQCR